MEVEEEPLHHNLLLLVHNMEADLLLFVHKMEMEAEAVIIHKMRRMNSPPPMPPSEEERGEKEVALPERRSGKAPMNEPLDEISTRTLQSRDKNHGFSIEKPVSRLPTTCGANFGRELSHYTTPDSTKRRRVPDLTKPDVEVISSHLLRHQRGTTESLTVLKPSAFRAWVPTGGLGTFGVSSSDQEMMEHANMPGCDMNPPCRRVVVDIHPGVDLLNDFSMATKLFEAFLGPEEKARLEEQDLKSLFTQLITSIQQTHQFTIATREKARDHTHKLMAHSGDVENLKSTVGVLQSEVSELRSKNAGLQAENEKLQAWQMELHGKLSSSEKVRAYLYSRNHALQERVANLEADLAELRTKNEMDRAQLQARLNALQVRRRNDRNVAELDSCWVSLQTRVDTLLEIQDGDLDLPMAITEAEAAANAAREALEQALSENDSESDDPLGLSDDESEDASDAPPLS
ncbi:hypothetical protein FXO37_31203 [Capsicum annuum]|nr:hypothetical protein FXO37_31203 [Capsicum annuum]